MNHKKIFFNSSLLLLLAAEGAAFDRAELDRMLDKVAKSNPPQDQLSFGASCYKISMPPQERFEYLCPKCGSRTIFQDKRVSEILFSSRNIIPLLKEQQIQASLDEREYCHQCSPKKEQFKESSIPLKVTVNAESALELTVIGVEERNGVYFNCRFEELWVKEADLEKVAPGKYRSLEKKTPLYRKGDEKTKIEIEFWEPPSHPVDIVPPGNELRPNGWLKIRWSPAFTPVRLRSDEVIVTESKKLPLAAPFQPEFYWSITVDGKSTRTKVDSQDYFILSAFLEGKDTVAMRRGSVRPLKEFLPRLRTIFGVENTNSIKNKKGTK